TLSHVEIDRGTARMVPEHLDISNADQHGTLVSNERIEQVKLLWQQRDRFPAAIASLLQQHEQQVILLKPIGPKTEDVVADLMRAAALHARQLGEPLRETDDAVPFLIQLVLHAQQTRVES